MATKAEEKALIESVVGDGSSATIPVNPECDTCMEHNKHCGECANPNCSVCISNDFYCGYCEFVTGKDNVEKCQKMLDEKGLSGEWEVVVADDYTLQLDIDKSADLAFFDKQFEILKKVVAIETIQIHPSKSGHWHVIIKTKKPYKMHDRIAMQACLGSDRLREILSFCGMKRKHVNPILLIEKKGLNDTTNSTEVLEY